MVGPGRSFVHMFIYLPPTVPRCCEVSKSDPIEPDILLLYPAPPQPHVLAQRGLQCQKYKNKSKITQPKH